MLETWRTQQPPEGNAFRDQDHLPLQFHLLEPALNIKACHLVDMNMGGAVLALGADEHKLGNERQATFAIKAQDCRRRVVLDTLVKDSITVGQHQIYQVDFLDSEVLHRNLPPAVLSKLNRRTAFRIPVGNKYAIVRWSQRVIKGCIVDLSTTGMGLEVKNRPAEELATGQAAELVFFIPRAKKLACVRSQIAHVRQEQNQYRLGLKFDWEGTAEGKTWKSMITRYVIRKQVTDLRNDIRT